MRIFHATSLCLALFPLAAVAQESKAPGPFTLASVAWIAGDWRGGEKDMVSQEVWMEPAGDCMVGMWRLVLGGRLELSEHLTLVQGPSGVVMHLRHFDRSGIGWEEKDQPLVLPLVKAGDGEAVFESASTPKGPLKITYGRQADGSLAVRVAHGDEKPSTYTFRRTR